MVLKNRKKTLQDDINRLFKNSMLTGIPQIIAAGNWKKKITRSLVFVFCVAGFIYQTLLFMKVYLKYETVVDVQVYSPIEIDKPAFTVCSEIGFMSSRFCPLVDEEFTKSTGVECETIEDDEYYDYCFCHPRMCTKDKGLKNITIIKVSGIYWIHEQPWDYVKQFVGSDQDYMKSCSEVNLHLNDNSRDCKPPNNSITVPCYANGFYPEGCFTRDSLYGKPDSKPEKVLSFGEIWLTIKLFEMEYPEKRREPRSFIGFHSPYTIRSPMTNGYILERFHTYQFRLSKVVKNLLPYPYETGCIDYMDMWKARGGSLVSHARNGRFSATCVCHAERKVAYCCERCEASSHSCWITESVFNTCKECIQECLRNRSLEVHGCLVRGIDYPGFDQHCKVFKEDIDLISGSKECMDKRCKPACYEEYYIAEAEESAEPKLESCHKKDLLEYRNDEASIVISYSGMETTVYTYSPKYQDIETFSYVGGYVGIWLGISLIAVFDFLETVVTLMQYPFKRMRRLKQKNKVKPLYPETERIY